MGKLPEWVKQPFERTLDDVERAADLFHLSMAGISSLRAAPHA